MLQATGHPSEIPGILPAISAGYRGTVLVVKGVWLVMDSLIPIAVLLGYLYLSEVPNRDPNHGSDKLSREIADQNLF